MEVGNVGLTQVEQQTHFAFWAAAKSPLIISTDLTEISDEALDILTNKRVIALNVSTSKALFNVFLSCSEYYLSYQQDSLGQSISFKRRYTNEYDVWAGSLADGSIVAGMFHRNESR